MPAVSDSLSLIYFQTKQSNSDSRLFFRQEKFSPVSVMNRSMKNAEILFKTVIILCVKLFVFTVKDIFKPYEKFHSTALDAGKLAKSLFAKNLILYHTEDETLQTRKSTYTSEARTVFNGNIFVPDDFEVIDLK